MSEHKVTEHITQTGTHVSVKIYCSCGIVVEDDTRRTPLRVLRGSMTKLHKLESENSSKKQKLVVKPNVEDDASATNVYGDDDDFATPEQKEE